MGFSGGVRPGNQGAAAPVPGGSRQPDPVSGGKEGFGSKIQSGRRGSSLLEAAQRGAGTEPWGSRRKCPVGREQKGSICSSSSRADNSSIAVCEFLHGEKTRTRKSL